METIIVGGVSLISQGILTNAISDVYKSLKNGSKHTYFSKVLQELDLQVNIEVVEALLKDIEGRDPLPHDHTVKLCMSHIHDTINKIKEEIDIISLKIIDQQYSTYNYWAVVPFYANKKQNIEDYEVNIKNLKRYKEQLDARVETLIKILSLNKIKLKIY